MSHGEYYTQYLSSANNLKKTVLDAAERQTQAQATHTYCQAKADASKVSLLSAHTHTHFWL